MVASPFYQAVASPYVAAATVTKTVEKKANGAEVVNEVEYKPQVISTYAAQPQIVAAAQPQQVISTYAAQPLVSTYAAQPAVVPSYYAAAQPAVYNTVVRPAVQQETYSAKNGAVEHTVTRTVAKREAEAEADPYLLYSGAYNGAYVAPYAGAFASPYAANWAAPYAAAAYSPLAYSPYAVRASTYANDAVRPNNYAAKGQYVAANAGAIHVAKRSAEAEADPALYYANAAYTAPVISAAAALPYTYSAGYTPVAATYAATPAVTYASGYYPYAATSAYSYYY